MSATYLIDGKPHRLCGCDQMKPECPRGVRRSEQTCGYGRCFIPAPDVLIAAPSVEPTTQSIPLLRRFKQERDRCADALRLIDPKHPALAGIPTAVEQWNNLLDALGEELQPAAAPTAQAPERHWACTLSCQSGTCLPRECKRAHSPTAVDVGEIIRDVAELPDRSSPEDWPEAMLVTADELRLIIERHSTAPTAQASVAALDRMVNRFLTWPLPDSVCSDQCATIRGYPHRTGTTLLTAGEARQMLEHVLAAPSVEPEAATDAMKHCTKEQAQ